MACYVVEIAVETASDLPESRLLDLEAVAEVEGDWSLSRRAAGPGFDLTLYTDAEDAPAAAEAAVEIASGWMAKHEVAGGMAELRVRAEQQYQADVLAPSIPELAGAADVAEILGVSRQRVHQLAAEHPQFPAPVARISAGPIWAVPVIEWFASVWERRPGRPPAGTATVTALPQPKTAARSARSAVTGKFQTPAAKTREGRRRA